jgi:hypothetical protein
VSLTRLLSVITWYHLAFFAIATAMLGMTAGATTVYLMPARYATERLDQTIARSCLAYALVVPLALVLLCMTPLDITLSLMTLLALFGATMVCSVPFYFSGIALTLVLTRQPMPIGKLYAADLVGASLGCLFVLWGLELLDAPSFILLCGAIGALAALAFTGASPSPRFTRTAVWVLVILAAATVVNNATPYGVKPMVVKGRFESVEDYFTERWNSFSRVVVYKPSYAEPQYWGPSPVAPTNQVILQYPMNIDGAAATTLRPFGDKRDIEHLRYDVTNIAYYLRPNGGAFVIGVGAGRDIQSAILFGHKRVVGVDVNPIFIDLLTGEFRDFVGIAGRPGVRLLTEEARSYLSRNKDQYSVIQMSLIDTWAATGAGAFSLTENALYTLEAWQVFYSRLAADGIFTVSRWYTPKNLSETGRVVSLAVATLLESGVTDPSRHIALVTAENISTLLLSKQPFGGGSLAALSAVASDLRFDVAITPGRPPDNDILRRIVGVHSMAELHEAIADMPVNYEPPTDERPYFFNVLRLSNLSPLRYTNLAVVRGNLIATLTLLALIFSLGLIAAATIVVPLKVKARRERAAGRRAKVLWSGAMYFSLIGAGFMFMEVALIQRLSVFLSHPVYALGVLLFTIILSTGIGSFLSERLPLARAPWVYIYPAATVAAIVAIRYALPILLGKMVSAPMADKAAASVLAVFPVGMLMGFFFPTGMRIARLVSDDDTPWYWALNGILGVLCSALAVFVSIYSGISTSFYLAAVCYAAVLPCLIRLRAKLETVRGGVS